MSQLASVGRVVLIVAVSSIALSCDSSSEEDNFVVTYEVPFSAAAFQSAITNPYYPLIPGTTYRYKGEIDEGTEEIVVEVLNQTRDVAGVNARVVRDRVFLSGSLVEDTFDWFAQDTTGNVWYLGEDSKEYENGRVVSTEGSWETGVDGARAGIIMPAAPTVGQAYYQEFYEGEAEDRARVLSLNETVTVPAGTFNNCIRTEDTTPLEPDVIEHKFYCAGVGVVLEIDMEEDARFELQSVQEPD